MIVRINGKGYLAHRLIVKMILGVEAECIDHINRFRSDNRLVNLRATTYAENNKNLPLPASNRSGHVGVHWDRQRGAWLVNIKLNGKTKYVGRFKCKEEAKVARMAAQRLYNYHPNHGQTWRADCESK